MRDSDQPIESADPSGDPPTGWREDEIDQVSTLSSRTVAAIRAVDSEDATVPFAEPLAAWLAGDDWVARIRNLKQAIGQYGTGQIAEVSVRSLAIDEAVQAACQGPSGIRQVVLLGAGMDSRPYRLGLPQVAWFEVDVPAISALKQDLIEGVPETLRADAVVRTRQLTHIALDLALSLDALPERLFAAGLDADAPVLYVMEGLVYYLAGEDNQRLFNALPAVTRSRVLASCIPAMLRRLVNDPKVQAKAPHYRMIAPSWRTDLDQLRGTLGQRWRITQEINLVDQATQNGLTLAQDAAITVDHDHQDLAERVLVIDSR